MAYGTKYTIQSTNEQTGKTWKALIKEDGYAGANADLDGGPVPIDIRYRTVGFFGGTDYWNIATSTCEVQFVDDTTGLLSEVLAGNDRQFQIVVENTTDAQTEWTGFVIPDSYTYSLYRNGIGRLRATDGLEDLRALPYTNGGSLFTGRDDLVGVISDCLSQTGLDLGFAIHNNLYPHIGSNELTTSDDPTINLKADRDILRDADDNPYSRFDVLDQILISFGLQLYQVEGRWLMAHRKRNVFDSSGDVFKVYLYDKDGAAELTPTANWTARKEVSVNGDSGSFAIAPTAGGTIPIGSASVTYYHREPTDGLFGNTGFQSAIQTTGGSGIGNWRPGGTTPTAVVKSPGILSTQALYMDIIYESTTGFTTIPDDAIANLNDYVEQTANGTIQGGSGVTLQVDIDISMTGEGVSIDPAAGRVYFFIELHVGSYKCYRASHTGPYLWSTTPGTDEEKLHFEKGIILDTVQKISFTTADLDDGGSAISGTPYLKIYAATEDKNGGASNTQQVDQVYFDNVSITKLGAENVEANTATRISLTYSGNVNRSEPSTPVLVFGDGPDSGFKSRLTVLNGLGVEQNITGDWSYLPTVAASGYSLHQFLANQLLKEFGETNRKIRATILSNETSVAPKPYHYLVFENPQNATQHDYTWNELSWRPASSKSILTGSFIQFQETVFANQICTVDVKSNTALLQGISLAEGLPCLGTTPFGPPYLDFVWWSAYEEAASPAPVNGLYKSTVPINTASYPWETDSEPSDKLIVNAGGASASDAILHVRVDRASDIVFYTGRTTNTLYTCALDGSGSTDSTLTAWGLAINRTQQRVCIYNLSAFVEYDYALTSIRTLRTKTVTVEGCPAYDQSYTYCFTAQLNDGGTTDRIKRIDLSDLSITNVVDMSSLTLSSLDSAEMLVDEDAGYVFFLSTESPRKIYRFAYPGGGSLTTVISSAGRGLGLDRLNQRVIYSDTDGDMYSAKYDGTDPQKIYDYTSNLEIYAMDLGLS